MMIPSVGRIVHFVMPDGQRRPAIVVRVWDMPDYVESGKVNMQVFTDGNNDDPHVNDNEKCSRGEGKQTRCVVWRTIVPYSEEPKPGTWHWPTRVRE